MRPEGRRLLIVGHRGAAARAPENTAASLTAGLRAGADTIEIDTGITRDGRIILLHDTTLNRTTSGRGALRSKLWSDVAALDAGSWFSRAFEGEPPIDLDDALAMVRGRVPIVVEVKATTRERESGIDPDDRALVDGVLAAFERTGGLRGVTMSSAAWSLLAYAAEKVRGLDIALTVGSREKRDPIEWARRTGATALHPNQRLCSPAFVARARGIGMLVIAYTVNRASEVKPLIAAGIDGVFTDDPAAMRRIVERGRHDSPVGRDLALGIDQGSGGTRAVLVDASNEVVDVAEAAVATGRRRGGDIVQDAEAVAGSVVRAAEPLARRAGSLLAAAGLAAQRSSLVVWRRSDGRPVTPVLSWRRSAPYAPSPELAREAGAIARATGLTVRFPYGAIRLAALRAELPEIARGLDEGRLVAGPLGSFLVARLTGDRGGSCDPSLAQRTLAWDLGSRTWSEELASALGVPSSSWPEVVPSVAERGELRLGRRRVRLRALLGDVGAAVRGLDDAVAEREGTGVIVLGTGGFVVVPTGRTPQHIEGLLTTLLYEDADAPWYGIEGSVHGVASAIAEAGRRGGWNQLPLERIAARSTGARRSPRIVAAPEGTGTPDWDATPRFEIEPGPFTPEEVVRGTLDDLARRFGTIARLAKDGGSPPSRFIATGGLAAAPHLTAAIARAVGVEVTIDARPHRTALGAAILARDGR